MSQSAPSASFGEAPSLAAAGKSGPASKPALEQHIDLPSPIRREAGITEPVMESSPLLGSKAVPVLSKLNSKLTRFYRATPWYRWHLSSSKPISLRRTGEAFIEGQAAIGQLLLDGRFVLAGERVDLLEEDWFPTDVDPYWLQALHAFEWIKDLRAIGDAEATKAARHMVGSWMAHNKSYNALSWGAETTARRLLSWLCHFDYICDGAGAPFVRRLTQEIAVQANHLLLCYEDQAPGYTRFLMEKALIFAGYCLPDGNTLASDMLGRIEESLDTILRPDGGTQYGSPDMQIALMNDIADINDFHLASRLQSPNFLKASLNRMGPFMAMLILNDGSLANINQSVTPSKASLLDFSERCIGEVVPLKAAFASGLHRITARRATIIVDAGRMPPPGMGDHFYASALSFELTVGTQKVIANVGTHDRKSKWGNAQRSSSAQSSLTLNSYDSCEISADGQIGRQPTMVVSRLDETDAFFGIDMHHDGYRALGNARHYRSLKLARDGDYLEGEDLVTGPAELPGVIRFHLHHTVKAEYETGGGAALLHLPKGKSWLFRLDGGYLTIEDSVSLNGDSALKAQQLVVRLPEVHQATNPRDLHERRLFWSFEQLD